MKTKLLASVAAVAIAAAMPVHADSIDRNLTKGGVVLAQAQQSPDAGQTNPDQEALQRLQTAKPISELEEVSAGELVGTDVRNMQNEDIGDVEDVITDKGKITALVITRGGFLGVGASYYKVDIAKAKATQGDQGVVVLDMNAESLAAMPQVAKQNGKWVPAAADQSDGETMQDSTEKAPSSMQDENKKPSSETPSNE